MDKRFSKRFLMFLGLIFVGAFVVTAAIVFPLQYSGRAILILSFGQMWLLCLACAIVPCCVYNGFITILGRINELSHKGMIALVALCLPMALVAVPVGAVMLLPNIIIAFKKMLDKL